eukprot:scaffold180247_cov17-Tisochrysis_lutea.AAC.1
MAASCLWNEVAPPLLWLPLRCALARAVHPEESRHKGRSLEGDVPGRNTIQKQTKGKKRPGMPQPKNCPGPAALYCGSPGWGGYPWHRERSNSAIEESEH